MHVIQVILSLDSRLLQKTCKAQLLTIFMGIPAEDNLIMVIPAEKCTQLKAYMMPDGDCYMEPRRQAVQ